MERKTYTLTEIAHLLNRPRTTLSDWVEAFQDCIPAVKKGRTTRFPANAIEVFRAIAEMRAEGKSSEAIRQTLHAPITDSEKESTTAKADLPFWPDDLKRRIFQNVKQAQAEAAVTSEIHALTVPTLKKESESPLKLAQEPPAQPELITEPELNAKQQPSPDRISLPECTPIATVEPSTEEAASHLADAHVETVALVPVLPQEHHQEIQALQQALGEVRTEIATSTHSLLQQIATLNEQIRAQQFTIISLQQSLERARREQRSSLWKRLLVWQ